VRGDGPNIQFVSLVVTNRRVVRNKEGLAESHYILVEDQYGTWARGQRDYDQGSIKTYCSLEVIACQRLN
jgi:hypothetical protein